MISGELVLLKGARMVGCSSRASAQLTLRAREGEALPFLRRRRSAT